MISSENRFRFSESMRWRRPKNVRGKHMTTAEPSQAIETATIEDTSLLAFYRDMNLPERRTFWACAAGWALDGMDFMIYPLVIGTIITLWKVDAGAAGFAGTVTLLSSAVGGWLGGYISDRIGRVRTLQFTILWFSFFSLVCAFVQNFDQLLIARAILGLGFGGEWAAGAVLMGEAIRPQYRGRAVGSVQSGWAVGWGLAVLSQAILFSLMPAETAWRWMFAVGALPALLVFYLRRYVTEPDIAAETRVKQAASGDQPPLWIGRNSPNNMGCFMTRARGESGKSVGEAAVIGMLILRRHRRYSPAPSSCFRFAARPFTKNRSATSTAK